MDQVLVYKRDLSDLIPSSSLMMKTLSNNYFVKENKAITKVHNSVNKKKEFSEENRIEDE